MQHSMATDLRGNSFDLCDRIPRSWRQHAIGMHVRQRGGLLLVGCMHWRDFTQIQPTCSGEPTLMTSLSHAAKNSLSRCHATKERQIMSANAVVFREAIIKTSGKICGELFPYGETLWRLSGNSQQIVSPTPIGRVSCGILFSGQEL